MLCGMAKTKLYLLTGDFISAEEADKIGLVSATVPPERCLPKAMEVARKLAKAPQHALRSTKLALNQWVRDACLKSFDYSCALEMLNFTEEDVHEGIAAIQQKRAPVFPSAQLPPLPPARL